jgi:hypothetical protein
MATPGVAVFAALGLGDQVQPAHDLQPARGLGLATPAVQRRGGVVEGRVAAADEGTGLVAITFMGQLDAPGLAADGPGGQGGRGAAASPREPAASTTSALRGPISQVALALCSRYGASGLRSSTTAPPTSTAVPSRACASAPATQKALPPWSTS